MKVELSGQSRARLEQAGAFDVLIGITSEVNALDLRARIRALAGGALANGPRLAVAYPGVPDPELDTDLHSDPSEPMPSSLRFLPLDLPPQESNASPWWAVSSAQRLIAAASGILGARVTLMLAGDLSALSQGSLQSLVFPVAEKQFDLAMPVYHVTKYEGLLNSAILAPLERALYGRRVRFPLAPDFSCSTRMAARIARNIDGNGTAESQILWPSAIAAMSDLQLCQVHMDAPHAPPATALDLSGVLAQLVGSAFSQMESHAAQWQRVRGSQPTSVWGSPAANASADAQPIDTRPMIESFQLAARNLQEVWSLVLPPVALLELKRLTRLGVEQFQMPDELWARIVYDFALAHRLRTMSRVHLLGALTPLYLGWVASYVHSVAGLPAAGVEQRLERLAKTYEEQKPYLVSRWRWPDRFNP